MQEIKIKGTEIIKINGEHFVVNKGLDSTNIKKLDKAGKKAICRKILDTLYLKDLKIFHESSIKINENGQPCVYIYDQDNLATNRVYRLDYFRVINNIRNYGLVDTTKRYLLYVDYDLDKYELFTIQDNKIEDIKDIKQDIVEGKVCPLLEENK